MENVIDSFGFDVHANASVWKISKQNSKIQILKWCEDYFKNASGSYLNHGIIQRQSLMETNSNSSTVYFGEVCNATSFSPQNNSNSTLPTEMLFNDAAMMSVIVYCVLFVIAACSNLTVFITLFRNRHRRSRINRFILHLSTADLCVTFFMMPLEIAWHLTVSWNAGDVACRVMMFFRAFGFYLSSFILVTISLDRYFAILHPLSVSDADKRGRIMLVLAWLFSFLASLPQSIIFHVERHPEYTWFAQCVTFNFFPSDAHELAYNLFNMITVYALPLLVILAAYSLILLEITAKSRESKASSVCGHSSNRLRRSGIGRIERARIRTLKMTIVIVMVFIACWTPYFVISAWWWFDRESANAIDPKIQRGLFLFAVSNSCMDPIVYGLFTLDFKKELKRCCQWKRHDRYPGSTTHCVIPPLHNNGYRQNRSTKSIALSRIADMDGRRDVSRFIRQDDSRETTTTLTSTPELQRDRSIILKSSRSSHCRPLYQQNNFEC